MIHNTNATHTTHSTNVLHLLALGVTLASQYLIHVDASQPPKQIIGRICCKGCLFLRTERIGCGRCLSWRGRHDIFSPNN